MEQRNKDYKTKEWKEIRQKVLKLDHYQCTRCKRIFSAKDVLGGYTKEKRDTPLVHHTFELEKYPEWKYDIWVEINGKKVRNLVTLCFDCHEEIHGRRRKGKAKEVFMNEERFD